VTLSTFFIQFALLVCFIFYFYLNGAMIRSNYWVLVTPLLIIYMAALGLGVGTLIASLTTKYRDLALTVGFGVQLWMYATPVVYPMSQVPEKWRWIMMLNPMTAVVETFRYAFLGAGMVDARIWGLGIAVVLITLVLGVLLFSRTEKTFMDTV